MLIGYARISKLDERKSLETQKDQLKQFGVSPAMIYEECISGARDERVQLNLCLKALQEGDTLIVCTLDRLGRNLSHLIAIMEDLRQRKVGLNVLSGQAAQIDTSTAQGWLNFCIVAAFADYERKIIVERTMAGLSAARARGRNGGHPRRVTSEELKMAAKLMADRNNRAQDIAKFMKVTTNTLYQYLNSDGTYKQYAINVFGDELKEL